MKLLTEKNYHRFFEFGVIVKLAISIGETLLGILLYFVSTETINNIIYYFLGSELREVPRDRIWAFLLRGLEGFSGPASQGFIGAGAQSFWAFIFLTHGLAKLFLAVGLLKNKLWAYPASAVVFTLFVIYQTFTLARGYDLFLLILTLFDVALIGLILHEYRHKRRSSF